jgi:hypothetical protein
MTPVPIQPDWDSLPDADVVFLSQDRGEYASVNGTYTQTALDVAAALSEEGFTVAYEYPPEGAAGQIKLSAELVVEMAISFGGPLAAAAVCAGLRKVISHRWGSDTRVRVKWTRWKVGRVERESATFSGTAEQLGELFDSE